MSLTSTPSWTVEQYEQAADAYVRSLPLEHFMEGLPQSGQREITLESLAVLRARLPELQVFNELLVQYFHEGQLRQVVPDNMVRLSSASLRTPTCFITEMETVQPFLVLEYVSPTSHRKDYGQSFRKYEQELRVPYCLMFYPERQDLRLHHLVGDRYEKVLANDQGRFAIPELDLEVGLLDGWMRYWHRGDLLPLPADFEQQVQQERQRAEQERQRAEQERQRADQAERTAVQERQRVAQMEAEVARLRELLAQMQTGSPPQAPTEP